MREPRLTITTVLGAVATACILAQPAPSFAQGSTEEETKPASEARTLQIIELKWADASDVAALLQQFLVTSMLFPGERPPVAGDASKEAPETSVRRKSTRTRALDTHILADARANKLLVQTASVQSLEQILDLVKALDVPIEKNLVETHIYRAKNARADELAKVLKTLVGKQSGKPRVAGA